MWGPDDDDDDDDDYSSSSNDNDDEEERSPSIGERILTGIAETIIWTIIDSGDDE